MHGHYILKDGKPEPCDDLIEWATWFENGDARRLARDKLAGGTEVSTVFLGLDHSFGGPEPLLWETMIFGGPHDQDQWRYATEDEARAGHVAAVALAKDAEQANLSEQNWELALMLRLEGAALRNKHFHEAFRATMDAFGEGR